MRSSLRAAVALAVSVAAVTCAEFMTGPGRGETSASVHVAVAPQFSPEAARAYQSLVAAGNTITEVHVVLTAADGGTRDTVVAFPESSDTLQIDVVLPASAAGQTFNALLELRSADHTVLFTGTQVVVGRTANQPRGPITIVTIRYSGPGRSTKAVSLSPSDTSAVGSSTLTYVATALDSAGKPVPNLIVAWTSSDASIATVTSSPNATAIVQTTGKRGTVRIAATTPTGIAAGRNLTVAPVATRLAVIRGGGQTAVAGSALAQSFTVEARAADSLPVPGTPIVYRALTAGGSIASTVTAVADSAGRASAVMTLGKTGGAYRFEASSPGLPAVTVTDTATAAPAEYLSIVAGDGQSDSTGQALRPLVVAVTDQFGGVVAGASVVWAVESGSGATGSAITTSASDGTTSTAYTLGWTGGTDVIIASLAGVTASTGTVRFTANAIGRSAWRATIVAGANQVGASGSALPILVETRITDINGTPLSNQPVAWTVSGSGGFASPAISMSSPSGIASTRLTLGNVAGTVTVTASSGAARVSTSATAVSTATSIVNVAGDLQVGTVASAVGVAPSVRVKDASGNGLAGVQVVFAVATGGGVATGTTVTTNASGIATVGSWTLGTAAGPNSLSVSAGTLHSTFSATAAAGARSALTFTTATSGVAASNATLGTQPVVQLRDAFGNAVGSAGVVVTATITSGNGVLTNAASTTNAAGQATFTGLGVNGIAGVFTLAFNAAGCAGLTASVTLQPGVPTTLVLGAGDQQTTTVGSAVPVSPSVFVYDASGNRVSGVAVQFSVLASGSRVSSATTTDTVVTTFTNASGVAQLAAWRLSGVAGVNTMTATIVGSAAAPVTFSANGIAGAPSRFGVVGNAPATAVSGVAMSPRLVLQVEDAFGNPVRIATVAVTGSIASGNGRVNEASAVSNASGLVAFNELRITGPPGVYTLAFAAAGYTSFTIAIAIAAGAGAP